MMTLAMELLGTAVLTLMLLHAGASAFFTAILMGSTLGLLVLIFQDEIGPQFNPAMTIALWTLKKFDAADMFARMGAQVLGAAVALGLDNYLVQGTLSKPAGKFSARALLAEAVGTAIFALALAAASKRRAASLEAAALAGTGLFAGIMASYVASNSLLNPAVMLGVRGFGWEYVLGPIIGAISGMQLYAYISREPHTPAK